MEHKNTESLKRQAPYRNRHVTKLTQSLGSLAADQLKRYGKFPFLVISLQRRITTEYAGMLTIYLHEKKQVVTKLFAHISIIQQHGPCAAPLYDYHHYSAPLPTPSRMPNKASHTYYRNASG